MDKFFVDLIKKNSPVIQPMPPPPLPPGWKVWKTGDSRASVSVVFFDVYGTLFCSAAGDTVPDGGDELRSYFRRSVLDLHRSSPSAYPEVRVEEIWARFPGTRASHGGAGQEMALRYELAVNPVYPMPGALDAIKRLKASGCVLGIISNAQFFTPLLFEAFFGGSPEELGFENSLLFYSFELGEAKPSPSLYAAAARGLASMGISADRCLCVGNDMRNDAAPSLSAGFGAVLFAGDGRSLRLREGEGLPRPTYIIDSLADLPLLCTGP
jgi:putative hydrolase of the HAD superfamily